MAAADSDDRAPAAFASGAAKNDAAETPGKGTSYGEGTPDEAVDGDGAA